MNQERLSKMLNAIHANPGATYSELYRCLKWHRATLRKYVMLLENDGAVRRESGGGKKRDRFYHDE